MNNHLAQRITALLLVIALVFSLACTATAAEVDDAAMNDDTLVVTEECAPDTEEQNDDDTEAEADEEIEAIEIAEPEETEDTDVTEETEEPEQAEEAEESEAEVETAAQITTGWTAEVDNASGEYDFSFTYVEDNQKVTASDGYYSIPEATDVQVDGQSFTIRAGIYSFDQEGECRQELEQDNINVSVTQLSETNGVYTAAGETNYEIALGDVNCENQIISSDVELFSGVEELGGSYHNFKSGIDKGAYTGCFVHEDLKKVCYANKGALLTTTGSFHFYKSKLYQFSSVSGGAAIGKAFNGTHKFTNTLGASVSGLYNLNEVYFFQNGVGVKCDKSYHWFGNKLYYFKNSASQKAGLSVGTPYNGIHYCGSLPADAVGYTPKRWYKFENGKGTALNGFVESRLTWYKEGAVDTSVDGWKAIGKKTYYFNKGVAVTGWNYLRRNGKTYKYFFRDDGTLVEDLYEYFGKSMYSKRQKVYVNRWSCNITIYLYDEETKDYDIPTKSMVCSTSRSMNWGYGTYKVSKLGRWYHKGKWYWQYLTYIGHSGALFHSACYYSKNIHSMKPSNYNSMGYRNSDKCVRATVEACRIIYNLVEIQPKGAITCKYYYSKDCGPFGLKTIANTTGKVGGTRATDPTD